MLAPPKGNRANAKGVVSRPTSTHVTRRLGLVGYKEVPYLAIPPPSFSDLKKKRCGDVRRESLE
jgi:hypothetical protein